MTQPTAVLLALVLACAVGWLALTRLPADRQLERWLRTQPGVVTVVLHPTSAVAAGRAVVTAGLAAVEIPRPSARVGMSVPLSTEVVTRFMGAYEAFVAKHDALEGWTVDLRHAADAVLVARPSDNAVALDVLRAMRARPDVESVRLGLSPFPTSFRAVVRPGTDPVATASVVSAQVPTTPDRSPVWKSAAVVVQDAAGHEVRVEPGAEPSTRAALAFAEAVRLEGDRQVRLQVQRDGDAAMNSVLTIDATSTTGARTATALSSLGFGISSHRELIRVGHDATPTFDADAWSRTAGAPLREVPGVLAVTLDPGGEQKPPSVDVRVTPAVSLARISRALPPSVDHVEVHTARAAPDYDRDDALPVDPETVCPSGAAGSLNLAYTGPPLSLPAAADYVAAVRGAASPTCLHWAEPDEDSRFHTSYLAARTPLKANEWRRVVDVVVGRRALTDSAQPGLDLILPVPGQSWSTVLIAQAGRDDPTSSALDAETPDALRAARSAIEPVLAYWRARVAAG